MMLLWLLRIKSVITSVITFVIDHWQAFLILAILCAAFYYKTAYEREKQAYLTHIASDMQASKIRQAENKIKEDRHIKDILTLMQSHEKDMESIRNEYLKRTKKDSITIANLRRELRDQLAADTATGLPDIESNPERTAEEWRDSYSALARQYETLKDACAITTSDYNALRDWGDSVCNIVQCK